MTRAVSSLLAAVLPVFAVLGCLPAGAQDRWSQTRLTTGVDFSSGSYGQDRTTSILFVPTTLQIEEGNWIAKLTVPWLRVDGPALVLDGGGAVGDRDGINEGWGDVHLSVSYGIEALYDAGVFIDVTGRFKAPSASFEKGLGTGEPDFTFQVDGSFALGDIVPFATVGYTDIGNPSGFNLQNVLFASAGVQGPLTDDVTLGAVFDYRQASDRSTEDPKELLAYLSWRLSDVWSVNAYGTVGFSENSPDAGGGVQFTWRGFPGR